MKGLKIFIILILMGMVYSLGITLAENIQVNKAIQAFKDRSEFEEEVTIEYSLNNYQTRRYYKVSRETSFELEDTRSVFYNDTRKFLGQKGDIFMAQASPFPFNPLVHLFISSYFGGHAAIKTGDNRFVEAVGFPQDGETILDFILHPGDQPHDYSATVSNSYTNYWMNPVYRSESDPEFPYYGTRYR
ncbi:MAG: hypothetical protein RBR75_06360, partial [Acholeplasmataceae bacterium]|nr:hypothetical protein [Acholeplasmataceae bacterium]